MLSRKLVYKGRNQELKLLGLLKLLLLKSYNCLKDWSFYRRVKNLVNKKIKAAESENYKELLLSCSINKYFVSIAKVITDQLYSSFRGNEWEKFEIPDSTAFKLSPVTNGMVECQLAALQINKATGEDQIPAKLFNDAAPVIADSVEYIVNKSTETGTFPNLWKLARVIPLHKADSNVDMTNYHLISILPVLSKVLERI